MAQHQTYDERRQQIIQGALQAFSEKGYLGASNKEIAQAAGINSAPLIYHYFENKEALFQAVIQECMPPVNMVAQAERWQALPVRETLIHIGTEFVKAMSQPQTVHWSACCSAKPCANRRWPTRSTRAAPPTYLAFCTAISAISCSSSG
ncbi:MAG: TetR/AcrR family transcriptional regulator [Caldilineaceae bacterium]|nr:TetR/AcrR family transcriptional regulator [Caldilineaceae bacterium]